jgi:hypothetical protein
MSQRSKMTADAFGRNGLGSVGGEEGRLPSMRSFNPLPGRGADTLFDKSRRARWLARMVTHPDVSAFAARGYLDVRAARVLTDRQRS